MGDFMLNRYKDYNYIETVQLTKSRKAKVVTARDKNNPDKRKQHPYEVTVAPDLVISENVDLTKNGNFAPVSYQVLHNSCLSLQEKGFYALLLSWQLFTSNIVVLNEAALAKYLKETRKTVRTIANNLVEYGLINRRAYVYQGKPQVAYDLTPPEMWKLPISEGNDDTLIEEDYAEPVTIEEDYAEDDYTENDYAEDATYLNPIVMNRTNLDKVNYEDYQSPY